MDEELLTVDQAAQKLQMHPDTVRRLLRGKTLPGVKMGPRQWRVPASALRAYVNGQLKPSEGVLGELAQHVSDREALITKRKTAGHYGPEGDVAGSLLRNDQSHLKIEKEMLEKQQSLKDFIEGKPAASEKAE